MKHAKLSASSSHRWLVCPGSVEANSRKKRGSNVYALEGISAHALLEVCLRTGCAPEDFLGVRLGHDVDGTPLHETDEDMVDGVGYALDYVRAYVANNPKTRVLIEQPVQYGESIGCSDDDAFGTSDIILDNYPVEAVSVDYKHGTGHAVAVKDNSQLNLYLVGQRQAKGRYQRYRKVVVQPRLRGRKPVQEAPAVTDKALQDWVDKKVIPVVPVALGKNAPKVAGAHCRYCGDDGNCQAQYDLVLKKAKEEFKR